ncbi:MAG: DUF4859 domain-containing protein [Bacteroidales bacterium]|nr:DUF4859 domain-containing protein [Bacteroidales bacterium]
MKKLFYFIACLIALPMASWLLTSCGDNDNFSTPHVLTPGEIQTIRTQDSLDSVRRTMIDADTVFKYKISDQPAADGIWTNKPLYVDLDEIAKVFGLSSGQDVADGIVNGTVKGCAMNAETHAIIATQSTSNGLIGHWWQYNGDIGTWADNLANLVLFAEWQCWELQEDGHADLSECYYSVGQFPGRLETGFSYTFYEGMQYTGADEVTHRVIFQVLWRLPDPTKAEVIGEQSVEVTLPVNPKGYTLNPVSFNLSKVLNDLDLTTIVQKENLIATLPDGSYSQDQTADNGFWFNSEGRICTLGDADAKLEIVYPGSNNDPNTLGICLKPKKTEAGDVFKQDFGFFADGMISVVHVTVNVVAAEE